MDGVLVDAREWHYLAYNRALEPFGLEIAEAEHLTHFDGLPTRRKLEILTETKGLSPTLHEFINQLKQQYTMELIHTRCQPYFPHEFLISRLKSAGYRLAIASNSIRETVNVITEKISLAPYFEFTLSNEDIAKGKPDPEIYELAMTQFALGPSECLVVEDNENGIRAARAAGAHVLTVSSIEEVNWFNVDAAISAIEGGGDA